MTLPPFQSLYDAHRADIHRYLLAVAGPADADDCFQETWLAALRAYPGLERADNLRGWLFRIAQRKAVDAHRSRGRRPRPLADPPEAAARHEAPSAGKGGWRALASLPPKQRAAVFCRTLLDMPYGELAEVLDCSHDAARRNVHEGLKKLKEELKP